MLSPEKTCFISLSGETLLPVLHEQPQDKWLPVVVVWRPKPQPQARHEAMLHEVQLPDPKSSPMKTCCEA
jgi:hypothetical protein